MTLQRLSKHERRLSQQTGLLAVGRVAHAEFEGSANRAV